MGGKAPTSKVIGLRGGAEKRYVDLKRAVAGGLVRVEKIKLSPGKAGKPSLFIILTERGRLLAELGEKAGLQ